MKHFLFSVCLIFVFIHVISAAQSENNPIVSLKDADEFTQWVWESEWTVEAAPNIKMCGVDGGGEKRSSGKITDMLPIPHAGETWQLELEVIGDHTARLMVRNETGPLLATYRFDVEKMPQRLRKLIETERAYPGASVNRVWEYATEDNSISFRGFGPKNARDALTYPLSVISSDKSQSLTALESTFPAETTGGGSLLLDSTPSYNWTRSCGAAGNDSGNAADCQDDYVYVSGHAAASIDGQSHPGGSAFLLRKYSSGVSQWTRLWGSGVAEYAYDVAAAGTSVYVSGHAYGSVGGQSYVNRRDFCLTKYNTSGVQQWVRMRGTTQHDYGRSVCVDASGNVYIAGHVGYADLDGQTNNGGYDACLIKYDAGGNRQWTRMWGSSGGEYVYGAAFDGEDAIYVGGVTSGSFGGPSQTNQGNGDFFISKIDTDGNEVWHSIFGTSGEQMFYYDTGECLVSDPCGNVFLAGSSGPVGGLYDYFAAKYSRNGTEEWRDAWGAATNSTYGTTISVGRGGEAFVAGTTYGGFDGQSFSGTQGQIFLLKYDVDGYWQWTRLWGSSVGDFGVGSCISTAGAIYVSGNTRGSIDGQPYYGDGYNDVFVSRWSDTLSSLSLEIVSLSPDPGKEVVQAGTTLSKNDFMIITEPYDCVGSVTVAPLYYPTAGVYQVVGSCGDSAVTTTVTALQTDTILSVNNVEDITTLPMTNGMPVYTTTLSRIVFDQLVMMANAQGSVLDRIYDVDWNDWNNAIDVVQKAKSRGTLDVSQGLDWSDIKACLFDPVNAVDGSFYVDEIDLQLAGPDPFNIRRSYNSGNLAPSDVSPGWHLTRNYYLFVNNAVFDLAEGNDLPVNAEVRVPEADGTVVIYSRDASIPANRLYVNANASPSDTNAPLNNVNGNGIGARANLINTYIEYVPSNRNFYVHDGQGAVRHYTWREFGATNDLTYRKRPYLQREYRSNGNLLWFNYTSEGLPLYIVTGDASLSDFHNWALFEYHADNRLRKITATDGRSVQYFYDEYGDLTRVLRPDGTEILYEYEHFPMEGTPGMYSSHRIIRVEKPDSRILGNEYYEEGEAVGSETLTNGHYLVGRVKLQKVTQSSSSTLITNAWFNYTVVTNSGDPAVGSGYTEVYDALKNRMVYRFDTNRHVTAIEQYLKVRDAYGNPVMDGSNYTYSLYSTERRYWDDVNLTRTAIEDASSNVVFNWGATYDDRGNLLSEKITGNLSGNFAGDLQFDGNGLPLNGESAETRYTYTYHAANTNDTQNLISSITRPNGTVLRFVYASSSNSSLTARYLCRPDTDTNAFNNAVYSREFYEYNANQALTRRISDDGTASNKTDFTGVTQRRIAEFVPGSAIPTFGLPVTAYDKFYNGASEQTLLRRELQYDNRGNPTNVATYNSTNGYMFSANFGYDLMNRQTFAVDANGGQTDYTYDDNGNLIATDGPLTNLTDLSTFSYDYANRPIATVRNDGYGNILTNTFAYDGYGNEVARTNLHGQATYAYYDDLHRRTALMLPAIITAESNSVNPTILSDFDLFGNLTELVDANSNQTTFAYNARKQRTAAYYPDGTEEYFAYDMSGHLIQSVNPDGTYTLYEYDLLDRVTNRIICAAGNTPLARYATAYNAFGVTAETDANTNTTTYAYDWAGRLEYEYGPGSSSERVQVQYLYDDLSRVREQRTWFGENAGDYTATVYAYDNLGRVVSEEVQDSGGSALLRYEYGYDAAGNRNLTRTFPAIATGGAETHTEYDALNNPVSMSDALSNQTSIAYDYSGTGLKTTITDPLTNKTVTILDALGRETTIERRNAANDLLRLTEYRHDPNGNLTRTIESVIGSNHVITAGWTYDSRNRISTMTEALGSADERTTHYFYNNLGQLYSQKNPNGVELFHFYDNRGRVANLVSGDNTIRYRYQYDANNNLVAVQDIVTGQTTTREVDEYNRLKKETQATGFVFEYAYDRAGRLTRLLMPGSNAVDYVYNAAFMTAVQRMTNTATLGATGNLVWQHSYTSNDLAGNLLSATLASGQPQTFQTDRLNRRTWVSGPAWTQTVAVGTSGYDPAGNLKDFTVNDPGSVLSFSHTYDGLYQLASEAGVVSRTYAHDSIGNRLSIDSGAVSYNYNNLNELLLQSASTNVLTGSIRVPVSGLHGSTKLAEDVGSVSVKLDAGGTLSATVYTNGTWEYVDAGLKGLNVPVDGSDHTIIATATTTNGISNAKTVTVAYASTTVSDCIYDQNGNLIQRTEHGSNAVVWTYTYDALNRMAAATKACPTCDPVMVQCAYDPFHRRLSKTVVVGSTTSLVQQFLWDGNNEIGATDESGNLLQLRTLGIGLGQEVGAAVAVEIRTNAASAWTVYVPVHDHRGNVVVLLNKTSGAVAEYYRYDAFGNVHIYNPSHTLLPESGIDNPWQFASKRVDEETELIYFGRRYYDPEIGRFVTCDPLGFADGPNRYLYGQANPLGMIDPTGLLAKGAGMGLKDLGVGIGQLFWNTGGSLAYGVVSIFDYDLAEYVYGEQAEGMRNMGYGLGKLVWDTGGSIGYMNTRRVAPEFAQEVYGKQLEGFKESLVAMSGGEGRSGSYRTGYVGSQVVVFYLLGKYGNKPIGEKSVIPKSTGEGTYLYQKVGPKGEHLKYGITKNPATRYTKQQLVGGKLRIIAEGSKKEMLSLERLLHETLPIGPEEGQLFYIQKQVQQGLTPPPYGN